MRKENILLIIIFFVPFLSFGNNSFYDTTIIAKDTMIPIGDKLELLNKTNDSIKVLTDSVTLVSYKTIRANKELDSLNKLLKIVLKKDSAKYTALSERLEITKLNLEKQRNDSVRMQHSLSIQREDSILITNTLKEQVQKLEESKAALIKDTAGLHNNKEKLAKDTASLNKDKTDFAKQIETIKATIANQLDSAEVIGQIDMFDSVKICKHKKGLGNDSIAFTRINHIHINVHEGIILEIIVTTEFGTFRNKNFMADLLHFEKFNSFQLEYVKQKYRPDGDSLYVFLDDVIKYTPIRSFSDIPYADFNIDLLPPDKKFYIIQESTSLNTYFTVAAFTDIKGIGGEPNGIAQFTGDAKFILNTQLLKSKKEFKNDSKKSSNQYHTKNSSFVPFNYISFRAGLSKFDNDFKGTGLLKDSSVNRKELLQRSNYAVGVKLNLLKKILQPSPYFLHSYAELNAGFNFIGSKTFDTVLKGTFIDTTYTNITQNQFYIEPTITYSRHRNFCMTLAIPFYMNSVKQSANIKNRGTEYWICPSINLMYYGKRDNSSKIFFRYNHFINLKDKEFAFSQIQMGYSVNLTEVWGNNK